MIRPNVALVISRILLCAICFDLATTQSVMAEDPVAAPRANYEIPTLPPTYFSGPLSGARQSLSNGDIQATIKALDSQIPPKAPSAVKAKGEILRAIALQSTGDDQGALKALDRSLAERVADSDALYLKAVSLRRLGKFDDARKVLEEALWFSKNNFIKLEVVQLELARCFILLDKRDKAMEFLQKAILVNPRSAPILLETGRLNLAMGNKDIAVGNLRAAVEEAPANPEVKIALAEALITGTKRGVNQDPVKEARDIAKQVMDSSKTGAPIWRASVRVYTRASIEIGELADAEKVIKGAIRTTPQEPEFHKLQQQIATEKKAKEATSEEKA